MFPKSIGGNVHHKLQGMLSICNLQVLEGACECQVHGWQLMPFTLDAPERATFGSS